MPTGLPDLTEIAEGARSALGAASDHVRSVVDYLHIPSYVEYTDSVRQAWGDAIRASRSSWHLFYLTFRPLFILLAFLSRYLAILLKILAECTIKHGIVAAREGAGQTRIAARWFVAWQRSLSRAAVLAELGVTAGMVGLYLLRRHIRKKRYVERVKGWCARRKARALRRYNNFVVKVSQTSVFLAMLLPHAFYILLVVTCKYFAPWLLRYFATKTYMTALISLWVPFVRTVMLIHRWKDTVQKQKRALEVGSKEGAGSNGEKRTKGAKSKGDATKGFSLRGKKTSKVAGRYLKETEQSSSLSPNSTARLRRERIISREEEGADSVDQVFEDTIELLKYWVVFALVCAICRMASLLPVVGQIISASVPVNKVANGSRGFAGRGRGVASFWSSLKLSYGFVQEAKLVFFVWLRYLPTSLTGIGHLGGSPKNAVKAKTATWEKRASNTEGSFSNRPLDILYQRLAPIAISAADSSSNLSKATDSDTGIKGLLHQGMKFLRSFLQIAVFMKAISESTKNWIETTLIECSALLPAFVTLLMPGYFTEFGCIYVSRVVPAANSASAYGVVRMNRAANDHELSGEDISAAMRYLKYWVLHSLISMLLSSFAPLLAWIPLSTHATWLLWAYTQLESPTNMLYALFEWELKALGLLHRHDGDSEDLDVIETMTFSVLRRVSSALPSAASSNDFAVQDNQGTRQSSDSENDHTSADIDAAKAIAGAASDASGNGSEVQSVSDGVAVQDNKGMRQSSDTQHEASADADAADAIAEPTSDGKGSESKLQEVPSVSEDAPSHDSCLEANTAVNERDDGGDASESMTSAYSKQAPAETEVAEATVSNSSSNGQDIPSAEIVPSKESGMDVTIKATRKSDQKSES